MRLTTFGESHGPAIGGILDGVPSGFDIDHGAIQSALNMRRPGGPASGSRRKEKDEVQILSGIYGGKTLGTPIGFIIANTDARESDYDQLKDAYRPNHADFTYEAKYGIRDHRGGGRASARETACRLCAGAIAGQILSRFGIKVIAYTCRIGDIAYMADRGIAAEDIYASKVRCPDPATSLRMERLIQDIQAQADTIGGAVSCHISGVPAGLGEPVFDKLQARLAAAMMGIPAAKGFEYGQGFESTTARGSEVADLFVPGLPIATRTNFSGGIQGGISNGNDIRFRVAFKPAPTLLHPIGTVNRDGKPMILKMTGRHDPCVVPRAVPVVQAMACLVLLDALLLHRVSTLRLDLNP